MSKEMEDLARRGEAALTHYGVKGMRWGVRAAASGEVNPALTRNRTTAIKKARASVDKQKAAIKAAPTKEQRKALDTKLKQDPNYVAARLKTRGEKTVFTTLSLVGGLGLAALDGYSDLQNVERINADMQRVLEDTRNLETEVQYLSAYTSAQARQAQR